MITYKVEVNDRGDIRWRNEEGQLHCEHGPAVEYSYGYKAWYRNGQRHRKDGPAVEYSYGDKVWYQNGQLHREDGPAVEYSYGDKVWYLNGVKMTEEEHASVVSRKIIKIGNSVKFKKSPKSSMKYTVKTISDNLVLLVTESGLPVGAKLDELYLV